MNNCLITGEDLTVNTQVEHTIPAKLGGRIRSREVASNSFNSRCGSTIDRDLVDSYWTFMMLLAPLLATEHQPGKHEVEYPQTKQRFIVDSKGFVQAKGTTITARDPKTGKPTGAAAQDTEAILRVLEPNISASEKIIIFNEPPITGLAKLPQSRLISPQIELAVLKSSLLSFEALLQPKHIRFTRSHELQPLRDTLRGMIMDGADDSTFLHTVSLGIQYEKLDLIRELRKKVDFPHTDFEHVLIASANVPTRTIDVVAYLFETDPYGFRLTSNWQGESFTYIIVNGVLCDTQASEVMYLPSTHLLCRSTLRRCTTSHQLSDPEMRTVAEEIIDVRSNSLRRATYLLLQTSDWCLRKALSEAALPHRDQSYAMLNVVRGKLAQNYEQRLKNKASRIQFDQIVDRHFENVPSAIKLEKAEHESELDGLSWAIWISLFRRILEDVTAELGLPGDFEYRVPTADVQSN